MTRTKLILGLAILLAGAIPARALVVVYVDPKTKKEIEVRSAVAEESPEGITINKGAPFEISYTKVGMVTRRNTTLAKIPLPIKVAPGDIKDYQLGEGDIMGVSYLLDFRPALAMAERAANPALKEPERLKLLRDSLPLFETLKPKVQNIVAAKRYVEFKHAETLYRLSAADDKMREPAMAALAAYQQQNAAGWQIAPALTMLAQLQEDQGDLAAVQKTYQTLADIPGLSVELRVNSLINASRTLMKLEKFADARTRLNQLKQTLPADSPLGGKVDLYIAQCQLLGDNAAEAQQAEQRLRQFLGGADDKALKALAHNTLGDYYAKAKRDEDAFWEYLRVDTLFSDDKFEHARAMYHLIRLFRDVKKEPERAAQYEETLTKDPRFTGQEYQKKALKK